MTDYEAIAKRLDNQGPIPSVLLCREAAAALRELSRQRIGMLETIGSLIEDRDKLIEAGEALHQRVMRADARIVALEAERMWAEGKP